MKYFISVFFVLWLTACATPSQVYWDHKVKSLCKKDGGVTVYEKVELTRDEYEKNDGANGIIHVMPESTSLNHHEYAWKSVTLTVNDNPYVRRTEYITFRKSDKKELGKWVTYSRRGGDIPTGISHPSSFSCNDIDGFEKNLTREIFLFKGE
jgi:hypothetical protein